MPADLERRVEADRAFHVHELGDIGEFGAQGLFEDRFGIRTGQMKLGKLGSAIAQFDWLGAQVPVEVLQQLVVETRVDVEPEPMITAIDQNVVDERVAQGLARDDRRNRLRSRRPAARF